MLQEKIKVTIPEELLNELQGTEGIEIISAKESHNTNESLALDLNMLDPDTLLTIGKAFVTVIGLISNLNGATIFIGKLKNYFAKHKEAKEIRIQTSTRQFVIGANTTPELYKQFEDFLNGLSK